MKKTVLFFSIIMLVIGCTGCSLQNSDLTVLLTGISDGAPDLGAVPVYRFADEETYSDHHFDDDAVAVINGQTVTGVLHDVEYQDYNYYPTARYRGDDGSEFDIEPNGTVTFWYSPRTADISSDKITENEAESIAKEFLSQFADVDLYETDITDQPDRSRYEIWFTKRIGNMDTTDCAAVRVFYSGTIDNYGSFMLNHVPNDTENIFAEVDLDSIVYDGLDKILQNVSNDYNNIKYGEPTYLLTVLKDGKTAVIAIVDVEMTNDDHFTSSRLELVIMES